jgi:hypothetical protein
MLGKLGGALRAKKMLRAATHMTTARYETKPLMLFRVGRISDMSTPHSDIFILPPSGRSDNESFIDWRLGVLHRKWKRSDSNCEPTTIQLRVVAKVDQVPAAIRFV